MNIQTTLTWLIRYGHVLGGAVWVGGYGLLALVLVPLLRREPSQRLHGVAISAVRVLTYSGMATIFFGLILITRTRGFPGLTGEWGALIISCIVIAFALMGIGDGWLRPALRRIADGDGGTTAQRAAYVGLGLTVLAVGLMTRALYAGS